MTCDSDYLSSQTERHKRVTAGHHIRCLLMICGGGCSENDLEDTISMFEGDHENFFA